LISFCFLGSTIFQSCKKSVETTSTEEAARRKPPPHDPPPPPPQFTLNCYAPVITGSFVAGVPTTATVTVTYSNSPGGTYPTYTSPTVNGITLTAPAGTLNVGSGSITYYASGTPISAGQLMMTVGLSGTAGCVFVITVSNPPVSCETPTDPGPTPGSLGCVTFTYRGQQVSYQTVRAKDGKIWLQQNLGSPQVAFGHSDETSFGDFFQWGRWDDGHQSFTSPIISGGPSLMNPSHIPTGNPNFITGWWGTGGLSTDTWSGTSATATNGKDPCVALGAGWRLPTAADWANVKNYEDLEGAMTAFSSNLKLPIAGYRSGNINFGNGESYYWSSTASGNYATVLFISDNTYSSTLQANYRGYGIPCRCLKD
jgi:hypothetical protein